MCLHLHILNYFKTNLVYFFTRINTKYLFNFEKKINQKIKIEGKKIVGLNFDALHCYRVYYIEVVIIIAPLITTNSEHTSCVSIMNNFQGKLVDENHMFRGINIDAAFN